MSDSSKPNGPPSADGGDKLSLLQVLSMLQESNAAANNNNTNNSANVFCSACDLCRSRKRKCDGKRPCTNCILSYVKKNKDNHVNYVGVDLITEVKCVYSLAKKRGPAPKRMRQGNDNNSSSSSDEEEKNGKSRKKQTTPLLAQDVSSPAPAVASANHSATAATSILNFLGMANPTTALSRDLLQIRQADLGPMSVASLNQSFFPSVGNAQSATSGHAALQLQLLLQAHQMEVQQRQAQQLPSLLCPPQQPSKVQQQLQVQQGGLPSNSNAESLCQIHPHISRGW